MNVFNCLSYRNLVTSMLAGIFLISCSNRNVMPLDQSIRLESYIKSDNMYIASMFSDKDMARCDVQPALTRTELNILDGLADRVSPEVRTEFDKKYTAWLDCWAPLDSLPIKSGNIRNSLKCSGAEFKDLIEFCRQQNDDIFLLLYQLAARAECPYDQFLLHPMFDLIESFPEFKKYWAEVNLSLENEKPDPEDRACNESTIWYTRKILEKKYGYTYASGLTALFDARKMLLMTQ